MGAPAVPPVIPVPWATSNPAFTNTIPPTTATAGLASWAQGFPAATMQPVVAGGVPPYGQDENGLGFALSSHDYYVQAGELYPYQAAVSTAIGGYGAGCVLGSATDPDVVWFNTIANNTTNPDATDGSAVGWVSLWAYGFATPAAMTGAAPVTLTNLQASRKFIVFTGALAANQTVSLPASILKDWLIINNTTGAFTLTLQTTAGGSSGVVVPQGGFSNPLGVYSDGTNVYPTVTPLGIPIDQSATPLTLVERTNNGYVLATYFNSAIGADNMGIANVYTDSGDDYIRKNSLANFEAQLLLSALGGQVSAGQVPLAAVIQYAANILASAALTGTPTAPTAGAGTSNTQVATTAFAAGTTALAGGNGAGTQSSFTLPNGVTIKFGQTGFFSGSTNAVTFTNPFGTLGYVAFAIPLNNSADISMSAVPGVGGFTIVGGATGITCMWIAIGK